MWVDKSNRVHTIALPDPLEYLGPEIIGRIRNSSAEERSETVRVIEGEQERALAKAPDGPWGAKKEFPPPDFFHHTFGNLPLANDIRAAIRSVPKLWRLDIIFIFEDALDEIEDEVEA